jgi:hypothetical protein
MTLTKRVTDLESNLTETQSALASRSQELSGVASNYTAKMNDVLSQHKEELSTERQKSQQVRERAISYTYFIVLCMYVLQNYFFLLFT